MMRDQTPEAARLMRLVRLADLMDSRWRIPLTRMRIGLDSVIGWVPVVGDMTGAAVGAWILLEAARMGAPPLLLARMAANLGIDWAVGTVPVLGDLFDMVFKSNRRNLRLLSEHFLNAKR
ncbi:MAG TPA: DUF4112 domain-containing protein [Azospirillaceae bacterium]|nr:DUF4112 domain-containing protein [Azospirillaceae bacterium]